MSFHKDQLEEMISSWTDKQLDDYIFKLEARAIELNQWIKELNRLVRLRKRAQKKPVDTGARDGR